MQNLEVFIQTVFSKLTGTYLYTFFRKYLVGDCFSAKISLRRDYPISVYDKVTKKLQGAHQDRRNSFHSCISDDDAFYFVKMLAAITGI